MNVTENEEPRLHDLEGQCACGDVRVRANVPKTYGVCHCRTCRRWTGGMWMGVVCEGTPKISGEVHIWRSSRHADRACCPNCGSSVWHRSQKMGVVTLGQGLFDDQNDWKMVRQVCIEEKPGHYAFGEGVPFTKWGTLMAVLTGRMPR